MTMLSGLVVLEPPSMCEIKKVELFTKWRPLIPEKYRDLTCPKPPPELIEITRQSKIEKRNRKIPERRP